MDSNSRYQVQQQHQHNSGLLRFRSAPPANLKQQGEAANNNGSAWEGSEPLLRFLNSGDTHDTTSSPTLREFVDNKVSNNSKPAKESSSPLSRMNSQQGYSTSMLPSRSTVTSAMMLGSMGIDQSAKSFDSNSLRQSSFPAGHFSNNISFQNGNLLVLYSVLVESFLFPHFLGHFNVSLDVRTFFLAPHGK